MKRSSKVLFRAIVGIPLYILSIPCAVVGFLYSFIGFGIKDGIKLHEALYKWFSSPIQNDK